MTLNQPKAIEASFGKVAPIAEQAAGDAICGLLSDFMIGEAPGSSPAAQRGGQ
jgi:hypothetical protein